MIGAVNPIASAQVHQVRAQMIERQALGALLGIYPKHEETAQERYERELKHRERRPLPYPGPEHDPANGSIDYYV